ncbi:uncharacterized protein [Miscanthus floridulus]|uniref:uncharacterized protein isoform X2 n=1 Tax=Miscanthus floridulus TaxID=154761 RepID=UPI003459D76A
MLLRCSPALLSFRLLRRRRFFVRCRCYPSSAASRRRRLAPPQGLGCGPGSASLGLPSILLGAVVGDCGRPSRFRRPGKRFPSSLLLRSLSTHASELWPGVAAPLFSHASVPPENLAVFQLVRVVQLVPVGAVVVPVGCLFFPGLREFGILKKGGSVCFGQNIKNKEKMFCFRMSYLAVLQAVAQHCCLSYVSVIRQTVEDGTNLYGVELQLPQHAAQGPSGTTLFFWAPPGLPALLLMRLHLCKPWNLARHLFPIANRGIHLARLVIATSSDAGAPCPLLLAVAQQLIDQATAHIPQSQKLCDPLDELTLTIDYYHKNVQKLHGYYETNKQKYISTRLQTETSSLAGNRWDWMNATEE